MFNYFSELLINPFPNKPSLIVHHNKPGCLQIVMWQVKVTAKVDNFSHDCLAGLI